MLHDSFILVCRIDRDKSLTHAEINMSSFYTSVILINFPPVCKQQRVHENVVGDCSFASIQYVNLYELGALGAVCHLYL